MNSPHQSTVARRACIRYPSSLISCSQLEPSGAFFTSAASCGLTQVGGDAGSTLRWVEVGVARSEFAIPTMYQKFPTTDRN